MPRLTCPRSEAFDAALGTLLRAQRRALGLSQANIAKRIGVTFQQLQKYEWGKNRVSAYMLVELAAALSVPVVELLPDFDELPLWAGGADGERL